MLVGDILKLSVNSFQLLAIEIVKDGDYFAAGFVYIFDRWQSILTGIKILQLVSPVNRANDLYTFLKFFTFTT